MDTPLDIQKETKKFFEISINQIINSFASFFKKSTSLSLSLMKETCSGEPCITVEAINTEDNSSLRIAGAVNSTIEQIAPYIKRLSEVLVSSGKSVILEGNEISSSETSDDIYYLNNIELKCLVKEDGSCDISYSPLGENCWKVFCSFEPVSANVPVSADTYFVAERSLGLILAGLGKTVQTSCEMRFNEYGLVKLPKAIIEFEFSEKTEL